MVITHKIFALNQQKLIQGIFFSIRQNMTLITKQKGGIYIAPYFAKKNEVISIAQIRKIRHDNTCRTKIEAERMAGAVVACLQYNVEFCLLLREQQSDLVQRHLGV